MQLCNIDYFGVAHYLIHRYGWEYMYSKLDPIVCDKVRGKYWDDDELSFLALYLRYQFEGVNNG